MTLDKLIAQLTALADKGCGDMEARLLCCDDNPIKNDAYRLTGVCNTGAPGQKRRRRVYRRNIVLGGDTDV